MLEKVDPLRGPITRPVVVRQEEGVDVEQATALVTSISMDAPDNDVSTCSISLTIDGEWTPAGT